MFLFDRFDERYLVPAAQLVVSRYQMLRQQIPLLPSRYAETSQILNLLHGMLGAKAPGVVATQNGKLVGFMTGWQMPEFRGQKSTFSPEWANAAIPEESEFIYGELYRELADIWVQEHYAAHYISIFASDTKAVRAIQWLGFGMLAIDALRSMDPVVQSDSRTSIIRGGMQNHQDLVMLNQALWEYQCSSPIFFIPDPISDQDLQEWLENPHKDVWMAYQDQEPIAFLRAGPANPDVSTVIFDQETTSIYGAYTREDMRGKEVGTDLLAKLIESAGKQGYVRCAVDFETMNLLGTRFWLRFFDPVCYSLVRLIDERIF